MRGYFLTFEGLDGSGKSTHMKDLARRLRNAGLEVVETREPGGTEVGVAIRQLFLDSRWGAMDGVVELLLVAASRRQHVLEVIEPALEAGRHVLCDRFVDSTWAYQGRGRGVETALLDAADRLATGGLRPDRTILFDLSPLEARRRGSSKSRRRRGQVNRLDAEELAFYGRVREGFLDLAAAEPHRIRRVDSEGPRAQTAAAVRAALSDLFTALEEP